MYEISSLLRRREVWPVKFDGDVLFVLNGNTVYYSFVFANPIESTKFIKFF
jgi:hypothetical protein